MLLKSLVISLLLATTLHPNVSLANNEMEQYITNRAILNKCIHSYNITQVVDDALINNIDKKLVIEEFKKVPNITVTEFNTVKDIVEFVYNTKKIGIGQVMLKECIKNNKVIVI